ncbi:hypothetical protein A3D05_00735 [Candidatus Gottesmanbacteria bacterium RIFCSPHIGHO2_02_FULL_40_24]|uniref:DUF3048 domain-containing protein n=1 Tax=Candidatus Gottesmanbacteria bacterium RIFCSPHIGHO2_01_FULL_40_15 TaxID=1798376 RepID=A0A1F5Z780_9BACT|nr:MAG: hypothetical protein A2777_01255 [Candidatus Gottesmanbacteria bacterium RIFCSPHIGHO2_01_FULL_40_15]OGG18264.1 MAG: hypothetical protein A3D05_00735 [Candidatus Gottesmanbacteria bacterium RIFCSPHIGHO2_02_FULL_40_24]OGG22490.1 MAG: hypothetical protein A3B48_04410 [Candidatus Gottesmanbacteria bacterium RIFCSPLOWO2_01_FULL_40_10]OGG31656.1 MAG: hypothetical protein A3I80_03045 [Candidatus Gottesmanbacteria bacterium RIFCSPLOWO2_02_FULL_40_10]
MKKISIFKILLGLALYFISSGISYAAFNLTNLSPPYITASLLNVSPSTKAKYKVDPSVPRDQVCPLNGVKYTKQESDIYDGRRPLAVMIENSEDSRPQSGVSRADIVYEAIAEGWITRWMGIFYCNTPMENIVFAPVRSARTYFVDWVSEYDALYNHVGGAGRCNDDTVDTRAKALCQIDRFGIKDLDQFSIGFPDCYRNPDRLDHPVATEHTMVCFSENLYKIAEKRDWTNVDDKDIPWDKNFHEWQFKDNPKADERGSTNSVKITFAKGYDSYITDWNYDRESNSYKRSTGGKIHLDLETKEPLTAKNIVIQLSKITGPVDDHAHILYQTIGNGKALIFQDGKAIVGTWSKKSRIGRTNYYDNLGKEIIFTRGAIWIELVPGEDQVVY